MNEAFIRRELYQCLRYHYGYWVHHIPDVKGSKRPGIPDLIVMNPSGPGIYIEVKAMRVRRQTAFDFSLIEESQRRFLASWLDVRPGGSFLALGTIGERPRQIFLVPWDKWLGVEGIVSEYQNSLPFEVGPGYRTEMQEGKLDFSLLNKYAMTRVPPADRCGADSGWRSDFIREVL